MMVRCYPLHKTMNECKSFLASVVVLDVDNDTVICLLYCIFNTNKIRTLLFDMLMMDDAEGSRAELGNQQHKNIKMNDDIHQILELRIDPTFSESSSEGSNTTPSSNNNKRKARSKSKKDKAKDEHAEAAQQRRCRIITMLSSIPFVLSLVALLIVLTKDKEDNQTTMSAASAMLDETDPISNTQSQMSMQPNDSHSNDDKANNYLTYDEVR